MEKNRRLVTRKCAACGGIFPKEELIRIVRNPEGEILPDPTGKAKGRGAYLCRKTECLKTAGKKRSLDRSFHMAVNPILYEMLLEGNRTGQEGA